MGAALESPVDESPKPKWRFSLKTRIVGMLAISIGMALLRPTSVGPFRDTS